MRRLALILLTFQLAAVSFSQERPDALRLYRAGNYAEAVRVCKDELGQLPRNMDSYTVMGWSLLGLRRYQEAYDQAMNALKIGMEKSKFSGRSDTMKLIEALEGLEMKEGDDFPQGDKVLRKEDHQAFIRQFIFDIKDGKHRIVETIPKEKTMFPPACTFA